MKPWHLHTPAEKIAKFQKDCKFCGKKYVDAGARWLHENFKCPKREAA